MIDWHDVIYIVGAMTGWFIVYVVAAPAVRPDITAPYTWEFTILGVMGLLLALGCTWSYVTSPRRSERATLT